MRHTQARVDGVDIQVPTLLRLPSVIGVTGLGRSTIYRLMADGGFPKPVQLAPRAVAWRRQDIIAWTNSRPVATGHRPDATTG